MVECVHCHKPLGRITKKSSITEAWAHPRCTKKAIIKKRKARKLLGTWVCDQCHGTARIYKNDWRTPKGWLRSECACGEFSDLHPRRAKLPSRIAAKLKIRTRKRKTNKWIKKAIKKKTRGALHRMLHIPMKQKIPTALLRRVLKSPRSSKLLKKRAQFALNVRKRHRA